MWLLGKPAFDQSSQDLYTFMFQGSGKLFLQKAHSLIIIFSSVQIFNQSVEPLCISVKQFAYDQEPIIEPYVSANAIDGLSNKFGVYGSGNNVKGFSQWKNLGNLDLYEKAFILRNGF